MCNRFLQITTVATVTDRMPISANIDNSGIVGEGLGLLLGVALADEDVDGLALAVVDGFEVAVAVGFVVGVGVGEAVVLVVGVGVAPALTTCTVPHIPKETCPGTGQI